MVSHWRETQSVSYFVSEEPSAPNWCEQFANLVSAARERARNPYIGIDDKAVA